MDGRTQLGQSSVDMCSIRQRSRALRILTALYLTSDGTAAAVVSLDYTAGRTVHLPWMVRSYSCICLFLSALFSRKQTIPSPPPDSQLLAAQIWLQHFIRFLALNSHSTSLAVQFWLDILVRTRIQHRRKSYPYTYVLVRTCTPSSLSKSSFSLCRIYRIHVRIDANNGYTIGTRSLVVPTYLEITYTHTQEMYDFLMKTEPDCRERENKKSALICIR